MNIFKTKVLAVAGIDNTNSIEAVAKSRDNIFKMTQIAEDAVLQPKNCGGFSHELRVWLAARIARQADEAELASQYMMSVDLTNNYHPSNHEAGMNLNILVNFVDKAANNTRDIESSDISKLQKKGFTDDNIVRLCQLLAFVAYQVRVAKGLRLMNQEGS